VAFHFTFAITGERQAVASAQGQELFDGWERPCRGPFPGAGPQHGSGRDVGGVPDGDQRSTRFGAMYFTVTVFSTVGFGDITANNRPQPAAW